MCQAFVDFIAGRRYGLTTCQKGRTKIRAQWLWDDEVGRPGCTRSHRNNVKALHRKLLSLVGLKQRPGDLSRRRALRLLAISARVSFPRVLQTPCWRAEEGGVDHSFPPKSVQIPLDCSDSVSTITTVANIKRILKWYERLCNPVARFSDRVKSGV
jgi:hypothetical protein